MMSRDLIKNVIEAGTFDALVGTRESEYFEVKRANPYDLTCAEGRYELAKDVSALANSSGGWLLIGLVTTPSANEASDEVSSLDLIAESDLDVIPMKGVIKEYIYPTIADLSITWVRSASNSALGAGVIYVPEQRADTKPFLIAKVVEGGKHLRQIVFGYARRLGPDSLPHDAARLHEAMRVGMNSTAQRLTCIVGKIDRALDLLERNSPVDQIAEPTPVERLSPRIDDILGI